MGTPAVATARGRLRVYLGAAPGVGKTYAMLGEGRRRSGRGTDVAIGFVETHGRARTAEMVDGLEVVPRKAMTHRGIPLTELDVAAVIARRPKVVLIDELAHTNVPGSRNAKRWEDIEEILDAGITVISTLNIQHLESVNDVVREITGVPQRETVPDEVVRRADQVELVDMAPEALRRRMAHGNVYPPEKVDAALSNYFRVGNLTALREVALLWVAGKVDEQLDRYRAEHGIGGTWETHERVVVALSGGPEGDALIRRAARIAARTKAADLLAVHVTTPDGLAPSDHASLVSQRVLVESMGGTYHQVIGDDVPRALIDFARGVNATQLVLGASRRSRFTQLFFRGVGVTATALSGPIDVHLVTHEEVSRGRRRSSSGAALSWRRRLAGWLLAVLGLPALTAILHGAGDAVTLSSQILLYLLMVVAVALVGGMWPALTAAVLSFGLLHVFLRPQQLLELIAFVLVANVVSMIVDLAARRTREAARAGADAEVLSTLAGNVLRGDSALPSLLVRLREMFGLAAVTLLERRPEAERSPGDRADPASWSVVASAGEPHATCPDEADDDVDTEEALVLALSGRLLDAADRRVLEAFAAEAAVALRQRRLEEQAEQVRPLAEADRIRTALLAEVGLDLRAPLSSVRGAVDRLGEAGSVEDRATLLATAVDSLDRLDRLVGAVVDMSRLQAGTIGVSLQPVPVGEVISLAAEDAGAKVDMELAEGLPEVVADPALLRRALGELVANAARHSAADGTVLVMASAYGSDAQIRVVDRGPGVRDDHGGAGLGLALSKGLAEAMGGALVPEETPGGGLTMTLTLPVTLPPAPPPEDR